MARTAKNIVEGIDTKAPRKPRVSKADRAEAKAQLAEAARIRAEHDARLEQAAIAEIEEQIALPRSVVNPNYKERYKVRAMEKGKKGKAAKRCNGDWLATTLNALCLDEQEKLRVDVFCDILDANQIAHAHWNRTTPGWQGRLRMTGRLSLQRAVAEEEALYLPDGTTKVPPRTWIAKHQH